MREVVTSSLVRSQSKIINPSTSWPEAPTVTGARPGDQWPGHPRATGKLQIVNNFYDFLLEQNTTDWTGGK